MMNSQHPHTNRTRSKSTLVLLLAAAAAAVAASPASADDEGVSTNLVPQHPVQQVVGHVLGEHSGSGDGLTQALR
ncbi:hypothetical protein [Streptomyces sp. NPDC006552]|uniref:hypothetical protein n=1 Tax=Streptomyces sp. NPDC006552 TaxID=3157179 RepID=UPI0033B18ED3